MSTLSSGNSEVKSKKKGWWDPPWPCWAGNLPKPAMTMLPQFREIWLVDFEFEFGGSKDNGELPRPVCLVAHELRSGRTIRQWRSEFADLPPYPTDDKALFVAYYASAEL